MCQNIPQSLILKYFNHCLLPLNSNLVLNYYQQYYSRQLMFMTLTTWWSPTPLIQYHSSFKISQLALLFFYVCVIMWKQTHIFKAQTDHDSYVKILSTMCIRDRMYRVLQSSCTTFLLDYKDPNNFARHSTNENVMFAEILSDFLK